MNRTFERGCFLTAVVYIHIHIRWYSYTEMSNQPVPLWTAAKQNHDDSWAARVFSVIFSSKFMRFMSRQFCARESKSTNWQTIFIFFTSILCRYCFYEFPKRCPWSRRNEISEIVPINTWFIHFSQFHLFISFFFAFLAWILLSLGFFFVCLIFAICCFCRWPKLHFYYDWIFVVVASAAIAPLSSSSSSICVSFRLHNEITQQYFIDMDIRSTELLIHFIFVVLWIVCHFFGTISR